MKEGMYWYSPAESHVCTRDGNVTQKKRYLTALAVLRKNTVVDVLLKNIYILTFKAWFFNFNLVCFNITLKKVTIIHA